MRVQAPLKMSMIILSDYIGIKSDYNLIHIMYKYKLYAQIYNTYFRYISLAVVVILCASLSWFSRSLRFSQFSGC